MHPISFMHFQEALQHGAGIPLMCRDTVYYLDTSFIINPKKTKGKTKPSPAMVLILLGNSLLGLGLEMLHHIQCTKQLPLPGARSNIFILVESLSFSLKSNKFPHLLDQSVGFVCTMFYLFIFLAFHAFHSPQITIKSKNAFRIYTFFLSSPSFT